jgi:hypothetical protein
MGREVLAPVDWVLIELLTLSGMGCLLTVEQQLMCREPISGPAQSTLVWSWLT